MLQHLTIENFTIIKHLELEFKSGMSVLTGETGAGKSILIDALLLALGERADSKVIRTGSERCQISADFNIRQFPRAQNWLNEHDLSDENECLLRRTLHADGRSKGFINGQPVPLQLLRELGHILVSIHGQHEHQTLLKSEQQRALLDAYAGHTDLVKDVYAFYQTWRKTQDELQHLTTQVEQRNLRQEFLQYQVNELNQLALQEHEIEKLNQEHKELAHAKQSLSNVQASLSLLNEDESGGVISLLNKAQTLLLDKNTSAQLRNSAELLNNAIIQVEEAVTELNGYCDHLDLSPEHLAELEQRLSAIYEIARKHRIAPENLLSYQQQLNQELHELQHSDAHLQQLQNKLIGLEKDYQQAAKKLSQSRKKSAAQLTQAVEKSIQQLGMPGGRFAIQCEANLNQQMASFGLETVEFFVSANPGQALQPLAKVASGGELSRISLAIHALTAQINATPTLIFDEVDVGIGGGTAEIVGRLLRQMGEHAQVLCVTHLPQVAALGHHHFQIGKTINKDTTETAVQVLDKEAKINEIARMLGGIKVTEQTLAHAREMVELS